MEKVGPRQCTNRATRSHPIPAPPKGRIQIQRDKVNTWGDGTPRTKRRRRTIATLTQVDKKEKRQEVKQRSPIGTRRSADKLW